MGMRPRYDESGKIIGAHNMIFDDISDQYKMQRVLIDKDIQEISYTAFMKQLRNAMVEEECRNLEGCAHYFEQWPNGFEEVKMKA